MRKKWVKVSVALVAALSLTGCSNTIPEMTEEQSAVVSEYAAGLLLSHMKNYQSKLVDDDTLAKLEVEAAEKAAKEQEKTAATQTAKETASDEKNVMKENVAVVDIADFLELKGIGIKYEGFEITDSYTENIDELAFSMDADAGHKLVVAKFKLTNNQPEDSLCDIFSKNARFSLDYGKGYKSVLVTMLSADFSLLNTTIPAGQSTETVLVLQIKEAEANDITKLSMRMSYNNQNAETALTQ